MPEYAAPYGPIRTLLDTTQFVGSRTFTETLSYTLRTASKFVTVLPLMTCPSPVKATAAPHRSKVLALTVVPCVDAQYTP